MNINVNAEEFITEVQVTKAAGISRATCLLFLSLAESNNTYDEVRSDIREQTKVELSDEEIELMIVVLEALISID